MDTRNSIDSINNSVRTVERGTAMTLSTWKRLLATVLSLSLLLTSLPAQAGKVTRYVHTGHLGSPAVKTDSTGAEMWRQSHSPYGEGEQGPTPDGPGYTGHRNDATTGLVYMQARYYDPVIGRFLSVDPVTFSPDKPQQFNRYWYANGNPYSYTDPDGNESACLYVSGCSSAHAPTETEIAVAETVVDFTPVVGDVKAIAEAVADPSATNVTTAIVGIIPGAGDAAGKAIKAAKGVGPKAGSAGGEGAKKAFSNKVKDQARKESNNTCVFCGTKTTREPGPTRSEIDHSIPKSRGGNNTVENAQNTCRTCNRSKGAKTTDEFLNQ